MAQRAPASAPPRPHLRSVGPDDPDEAPPDAPEDPRPVIRIHKGLGHEHIADALAALREDPDLYERTNGLVHVVGAPEPRATDRTQIARGTPIVRPLAISTLWARASRWIRWEKYNDKRNVYEPADPPAPVLAAIITCGDYPDLRPLSGVLEAPALRPDGTLIFGRGYDEPTGFLCVPTLDFVPPDPHPTQQQAHAALGQLREIFADFPHRTEADRMVPVAAILTLLARPAIVGACPALIFDASTRGSGKTLQADAAALVACGRVPPPMSYPDESEELEKVMGALAIAAPAVVKFDNVTCRFGGGPIDRVLTARDTTTFRVLGRSETPELPWRSVVMATGNNIEFKGDTTRRVIVCRVESTLERPEDRPESELRHHPLLDWIGRERVRLVRAGLTVLRAWVVAGRPRMSLPTWGGGFESWSGIVPSAIVHAGGANVLDCRPAATGEEEPEKVALGLILAGLTRLDTGGNGLTVREIIGHLYPKDRLRGEAAPDGFEDFREAVEILVPTREGTSPSAKTLGERLRYHGKGRVISGMRLDAQRATGGVQRWRAKSVDT